MIGSERAIRRIMDEFLTGAHVDVQRQFAGEILQWMTRVYIEGEVSAAEDDHSRLMACVFLLATEVDLRARPRRYVLTDLGRSIVETVDEPVTVEKAP